MSFHCTDFTWIGCVLLQVHKRSGAWFFKGRDQQRLPDPFPLSRPQQSYTDSSTPAGHSASQEPATYQQEHGNFHRESSQALHFAYMVYCNNDTVFLLMYDLLTMNWLNDWTDATFKWQKSIFKFIIPLSTLLHRTEICSPIQTHSNVIHDSLYHKHQDTHVVATGH